MTVAMGKWECDFEPRPHALSPFDGAHGAEPVTGLTVINVGRKGGDK